jgi:hypothetical protein
MANMTHPHIVAPRAYTVDEIDRMRAAVRMIITGGAQWISNGGEHIERLIARENATVEDHLRGYMASGASPVELAAKAADCRIASPDQPDARDLLST